MSSSDFLAIQYKFHSIYSLDIILFFGKSFLKTSFHIFVRYFKPTLSKFSNINTNIYPSVSMYTSKNCVCMYIQFLLKQFIKLWLSNLYPLSLQNKDDIEKRFTRTISSPSLVSFFLWCAQMSLFAFGVSRYFHFYKLEQLMPFLWIFFYTIFCVTFRVLIFSVLVIVIVS